MRVITRARTCALILAAGLAVAACGSDSPSTAPSGPTTAGSSAVTTTPTGPGTSDSVPAPTTTGAAEAPHVGGSITFGSDAEAGCFTPSLCTLSYGPAAVRSMALEFLVRPARNDVGYEFQLAESVKPNADKSSFSFTLRKGVKFSDGTPFTAGIVKQLFDTYVLVDGSLVRGNVTTVKSVDAPDDATLVFNLAGPQAPFPVVLASVPIWKPEPAMDKTSIPIGTGPFVIKSWEPNVKTEFVRNDLYWDKDANGQQLPYLDAITVIPTTSGDTRVNSLVAGDIDVAMSVDPLLTQQMADVARVLDPVALNAGSGLFFNNTGAPTDDLRVRKGLAFATDKEQILEAVGGGEVRNQYFVKSSPWYSEEAAAATPGFDKVEAKKLLDEYINDPTRSDGKPAGTPLTIDIAYVAGSITQESVVAVAQQQWEELGITVTVTPKDEATWVGDAVSGNFNVNYFLWATPHPYQLLTRNYAHWPEAKTNYTHFNSDELLDVVKRMAVAETPDQMTELVHEADMVIAEGVPLVFLQSTTNGWGVSDRIGNTDVRPGDGGLEWKTLSVTG